MKIHLPQITNGIGWVLLMLAFIFLRKSAWKFLRRGGLVSFFISIMKKMFDLSLGKF